MDEKRLQEYLQLIQKLQNVSSGKEIDKIFTENQNLLDVDFLQTMEAVAENASQQEDENTANWLRNLANQLSNALNLSSTTNLEHNLESLAEEEIQVYLQFLTQVLEVIHENDNAAKVVYPLLEANIDKLNANLAEILRRLAINIFKKVETEEAESIVINIALNIGDFSNLIQQFPLGNKASNMEIAIAGYEIILTFFTQKTYPQYWATVQCNLGAAYTDRIKGDKAENIENAIVSYQKALLVRTRENFPQDWAMTQNNLGNAYIERIKGDKAENIENAIVSYQLALSVINRKDFPQECAMMQNNLATAYTDRIKGDKAENIENAIVSYQKALLVRTCKDFPQDWAATQNNLGVAYSNRIKGNKAENIENTIASYQLALSIYTREDFPQKWAMTQNNLATAYIERIKGDKAENIENAIAFFQQALVVRTRKDFPQDWATTKNNLAAAYNDRIKGNKAENIENAIIASQQALSVYTCENFPQDWATTQNHLGNAYWQRIKGNKAENIENAIASFQQALVVRTRKDFPQDWAMTQNNLGFAYTLRIKGDKAENVENAIAYFQQALVVRTCKDFPQDWAMTQNNLGNSYRERIKGDKAENVENAIASFQQALSVYTRENFPQDWAMTQNDLGNAYWQRIKGDKAENIENAIASYQQALSVYTRENFPQDWAMTQNSLGIAYRERIKEDKAENIENAIASYQQALSVYTRENFPQDWAMLQNNLGTAYIERIEGDKAESIENAIASFQQALVVRTRKDFPQDWAMTQNNLAAAYRERIKGNKAENIENAIIASQQTLSVYTRENLPQDWAATQNHLGNSYNYRIKGNKAENIENAIASFQLALEVRTRENLPQDWAMTQNSLGIAYWQRIKGDKAENIENAITSFQLALSIYTPSTIPIECLRTTRNLGNLLLELKRWQEAINAYFQGIQAVELSRSWVDSESRRQEILENAIDVYTNIVQACINNEQPEKAIEYAERSKARNLVELLANRNLYPKGNISQETINELDRLRREITVKQRYLSSKTQSQATDTSSDENQIKAENKKREESRQLLEKLQQQLDELVKSKIQPNDPSFSLSQKVEPIKFEEIELLLNQHTAIIEWYITAEKIIAFIITPKPPTLLFGKKEENISVWQSHPEDLQDFVEWKNEYLRDYYEGNKNEKWRDQLKQRLENLAEILHINQLVAQIPKNCDKLILIPHNFLHLFPLHALEVRNECLLELFPSGVSYAPSCQLLQLAQNQKRLHCQSLFTIQNPTEDLMFTDLEVNRILSDFPQNQVLSKKQATKNNLLQNTSQLRQVHYLHLSCHGLFNPDSPLDSFLKLADAQISPITPDADNNNKAVDLEKCLTLSDLFNREFDLSQCRLVVLSACETGLIDFNNTSDEYIGLPSGFLYAGSASIVSSLWEVDDLSTAFLMIKFSQNLKATIDKKNPISVAVALNQAQLWLKNVTKSDLQRWVSQLSLDSTWSRKIRKQLNKFQPETKPFESPYYWAAFTAIGK